VDASAALACRVERLIIVNQKMRQLKKRCQQFDESVSRLASAGD
jgi:hypothetical protein